MNEMEALVGGGLADSGMTVTKVGDTNASGKVEESSTVLEFSPRPLAANHDRFTGDPPQSLRDVLGTNVL